MEHQLSKQELRAEKISRDEFKNIKRNEIYIVLEKWVDWEYVEDATQIVKKLKSNGVEITSVEVASNSIDYRQYEPKFPLCLILGREYDGVSQELLDLSDNVIHLPLLGMSNSINVSTAASVVMYYAFDKYEKNKNVM